MTVLRAVTALLAPALYALGVLANEVAELFPPPSTTA